MSADIIKFYARVSIGDDDDDSIEGTNPVAKKKIECEGLGRLRFTAHPSRRSSAGRTGNWYRRHRFRGQDRMSSLILGWLDNLENGILYRTL